MDDPVRRQVRRAALETSILDAAWTKFVTEGYLNFTFETVRSTLTTTAPLPSPGKLLGLGLCENISVGPNIV
jgi:hypothetical protein